MDNREKMKNDAYKKDKNIKSKAIEVQLNVNETKKLIDNMNKELKKDD